MSHPVSSVFLLNFLIVPELKITINPGASLSLAVCCYSNEIIMINTFELVIKRNEGHFDKKLIVYPKARYCSGLSPEEENELQLFAAQRKQNAFGRGSVRPYLPTSFTPTRCSMVRIYSLFQLERILLNTVSFTQYALLTQNRHFHFIIINL